MDKKRVTDKLNTKKCGYYDFKGKDIQIVRIDDLYQIITDRRYQYVSKYREEPDTIIMPEFVYILIQRYGAITFNNNGYETFMGMKIIVRRDKKVIEQIEVFKNLLNWR